MTQAAEQFEVRNRWTNAVQFTATITCAPDASISVKLGLAVRWAKDNGANLSDAYLRGANLSGANLRGADLSGAYLRDAYLRDANLRPIKADFFMILAMGHHEVPALIGALRDGRVDGSTYSGECACLVGTLENAGSSNLPHEASSPAEEWFAPIRKGVKPGDEGEGGFRSAKALEWALEYAARTGLEIPA